MKLDLSVIKRHAVAVIAKFPVTIRHMNVLIQATLNTTDDISQLMAGGLLDDPDATVIAIRTDFVALPKPRDLVDLLLAGSGGWKTFEVKRVIDYYHPLMPTIQFTIGTPNA